MRQFVEECWNRPNLTFGDLWWPDLWPDLKNDWSSFVMIFDALSNAVYRVSLRGPGAGSRDRRGGFQHPPPPAGGGKSRGLAGRGLRSTHLRRFHRSIIFLVHAIVKNRWKVFCNARWPQGHREVTVAIFQFSLSCLPVFRCSSVLLRDNNWSILGTDSLMQHPELQTSRM